MLSQLLQRYIRLYSPPLVSSPAEAMFVNRERRVFQKDTGLFDEAMFVLKPL